MANQTLVKSETRDASELSRIEFVYLMSMQTTDHVSYSSSMLSDTKRYDLSDEKFLDFHRNLDSVTVQFKINDFHLVDQPMIRRLLANLFCLAKRCDIHLNNSSFIEELVQLLRHMDAKEERKQLESLKNAEILRQRRIHVDSDEPHETDSGSSGPLHQERQEETRRCSSDTPLDVSKRMFKKEFIQDIWELDSSRPYSRLSVNNDKIENVFENEARRIFEEGCKFDGFKLSKKRMAKSGQLKNGIAEND